MDDPSVALTEAQATEFAYTDITKAPEQHRNVAIQWAMGLPVDEIAGATGYPRPYVEKILNHPPAVAYAEVMKRALDDQAVKLVGQWQSMLPKALEKFKSLMDSKSDTVALRAVTEYLDRERTLMFAKRKFVEGSQDKDIADTSAIDELKRNAAQLEGKHNDRASPRSDESARTAREAPPADSGSADGVSYPEPAGGTEVQDWPAAAWTPTDGTGDTDGGWPDTGSGSATATDDVERGSDSDAADGINILDREATDPGYPPD